MVIKSLPPVSAQVSVVALSAIANRAEQKFSELWGYLSEPHPPKVAPTFTSAEVAKLCNIERAHLNYLCTRGFKGGYPQGMLTGGSKNRVFTLAETQDFFRKNGNWKKRPNGQPGIVCAVGNFKKGVGKTTMAVTLAQGLALRGHKVCLLDFDPQANATRLMGYIPDTEITENMTIMPVVCANEQDLSYAPISSYWNGLYLVPSSPAVFGADYILQNRQVKDPSFEFWNVFDKALEPLRNKYDIIMIDTAPTLSYLTMGALMVADGWIVPIPSETLEYTSSTQFFRQFTDLYERLKGIKRDQKKFEFIKIVLSKVKTPAATTSPAKAWIKHTYYEMMATAEFIETDIVANASAQFQTIYDFTTYNGNQKTLARAIESFDKVVDEIDTVIQNAWIRVAASKEVILPQKERDQK